MIRTGTKGLWSGLCLTAGLLAAPGVIRAEAPRPGDIQRLPVITISLQVGSTEKETRQVTYTPPPGWYVRSHVVTCTRQSGHSSFSIATVPQNWTWSSEEKIRESYKALIDLAGKSGNAGLQGKFRFERDRMLEELRKVRSTHHALVVDATARGEGFLRGGGGIQLTVTAELVYVGTGESLDRTLARHRAKLK